MQNIMSIDLEGLVHPVRAGKTPGEEHYRIAKSLAKIKLVLSGFKKQQLTFFVVGEIAERFPDIVEDINDQGHEVAFHGFYHRPLWELDAESFRSEIQRFDRMIRNLVGEKCIGFRAPSCSINKWTSWALDVLEESEYLYDSSIFPVRSHLHAALSTPICPYHPSKHNVLEEDRNRNFAEFPILVYSLGRFRIPAGQGFFLRFLPLRFVERAIKKTNAAKSPAVLAFHPWEISRVAPQANSSKFRHFIRYYNIDEAEKRLKHFLSSFEFVSFREFIESEKLFDNFRGNGQKSKD